MAELLLKRGADRSVRIGRVAVSLNKWDLTSLNIAEMEGFIDIASLLREQ